MFCPTINGEIPVKSNFSLFWGVEPAQLTATILVNTPPTEVVYGGQAITLTMQVINYTKVEDGVYLIQAADEPYFWKNKRLTAKYDDPIEGVPISVFADAITTETGWTVSGVPDYKVPYIIFSGSVVEALNVLERLSGKLATLDHVNKEIILTSSIPHDNAPSGTIIEEGYSQSSASNIVCYGTLLKMTEDNFSAAHECNIDDYKYIDMAIPAEGWEITTATPTGVSEKVVGSISQTSSNVDYSAGYTEYSETTRIDIIKRCVNMVFVATTLALKQDEVLLVPPASIPQHIGDKEYKIQTREFGGEIYFETEGMEGTDDPFTGVETVGSYSIRFPSDRVHSLPNPDDAQIVTNEIMQKFSSGSEGLDIIITPNYAATSNTTTADYFFGYRVIVVGKLLIPFMMYERKYKYSYVGDVLRDVEEIGGPTDLPDAPTLDLAFISLYIRERVLRNLRFKLLLDGYRVKFPYYVSSDGSVGKDVNTNLDNTMYILLNEAPNIEAAKSYASLMYDIISKTGYVGILDAGPEGTTKYVEDFSGDLFRAVGYYRK